MSLCYNKLVHLAEQVTTSVLFNITRYFILSGGAFLLIWFFRDRFKRYRIQPRDAKREQILHDIRWSLSTATIQGSLSALVLLKGNSSVYYDVSKYGWPYVFISAVLMMLILDTYSYFSHRLLHWKPILKHIHIIHHRSKVPTAFSTIAFHPVESLVQWLVFPLIVYTVPCHITMMIVVFGFTFLVNNMGHLGYEFYPKGLVTHPIFRWSNSSTFHNMHHTHVSCNYGLYFNFWDTLFGTTHPDYPKLYERVKNQTP